MALIAKDLSRCKSAVELISKCMEAHPYQPNDIVMHLREPAIQADLMLMETANRRKRAHRLRGEMIKKMKALTLT